MRTSPSKAANLPHRNKWHTFPHSTVVLQMSDGGSEVNKMFTQFIARIDMYFRARATEQALRSLTDEALSDIGLLRADIAKMSAQATPVRTKTAAAFPLFSEAMFPVSGLRTA
ncbi:protein of unknown function [Methylobacterium gossipiicola]|uniref:YjiS-like domain-containing protein n=2 Tax=Methylobacterium gossipiicola TaxID=582675 RepID=A0A1I2VCS1_9HYPH|nr:protein of unknown function [Methylobacterium gossipiicola]